MRIYHFISEGGRGGVTIALDNREGPLRIGWSMCDPRDQFSRKRGRAIATGRLQSAKPNKLRDELAERYWGFSVEYLTARLLAQDIAAALGYVMEMSESGLEVVGRLNFEERGIGA